MRPVAPDRGVACGAALLGVGALAAVSLWIYSLQEDHTFWSAPGYVSVAVAALGLMIMIVYTLRPDAPAAGSHSMTQTAGDGSTNLQAGRDITATINADDSA